MRENLCSSRIRPLLTKVAIASYHVEQDQIAEGLQDQIAEGLLLGDDHRNYRLGILILV
jgi:hypothetical protein